MPSIKHMKAKRSPLPSHSSSRLCRRWASPLLAFLAAAAPVRADHIYNAWTQQFDLTSPNADEAKAVTTDSRGNVIVAGEVFNSGGVRQWYVAKYDGLDGHILHSGIILGPANAAISQSAPIGDSMVRSVTVDSQDNILVGGGSTFSNNNLEDFELIKLSPSLSQIWAHSLNNNAQNGADEIQRVAVDANDNVIVTGKSEGSGTGTDFLTVKYSSGGSLTFQRRLNNTGNSNDTPAGLAVDQNNGNIWVVGTSTNTPTLDQILTMAYDSAGNALNNNFPVKHSVQNGTGSAGSAAAAIALDSAGSAFITGTDFDNSGSHSIYTAKVISIGIPLFEQNYILSQTGDFLAFARDIAVGPDDNPVVTGLEDSGDGETEAVTLKYQGQAGGVGLGTLLWHRDDAGLSPKSTSNPDLPANPTAGEKVVVDGGGTVTIVGETDATGDGVTAYVARYDGDKGLPIAQSTFNNGLPSHDDLSTGIALDGSGNVSLCASIEREKMNGTADLGSEIHGILVQKFQRLIAETADPLPADGMTARKVASLTAPSLADTGDVVGRITLTEGKSKLGAIFTQGPAGGTELPLVQKMAAPNVSGFGNATFASFGDPVTSPDGHYAFTAKLAGGVPASKANSLWTNLGGSLKLVLQQGSPLPGLTSNNVSAIMSIALRDSQLLALVKVNGAANENVVLVSLDGAGNGTKLLRTSDQVTADSKTSTVKSITVLSPPPSEAGAGEWQGDASAIAKVTLADKRIVILKLVPNVAPLPILRTGQAADEVETGLTWNTFSFPSTSPSGTEFAALGTVNHGTEANGSTDTAIVVSPDGVNFNLVAREGSAFTGITGTSYLTLGNPLVNSTGVCSFIATLKATSGGGAKVTAANKQVIVRAVPGIAVKYARTGDTAPAAPSDVNLSTFGSFVSLVNPSGAIGLPVFVAKIAGKGITAKNNLAVFGGDSGGNLRRLIRTGDKLGKQVVTNITLLKATPQAFSAARSFDSEGNVVMLLTFSDHTTGILELLIP